MTIKYFLLPILFQRYFVISQSEVFSVEEFISYKLSQYSPSLFESSFLLRKANEAQLADAIRNHVRQSSSEAVITDYKPDCEHFVLDAGSLLH